MRPKTAERERAIALRKRGLSYSEIQAKVPVSQASLSSWLRHIDLDEVQRNRLCILKWQGQRKGADTKRLRRIERVSRVRAAASMEAKRFLSDGDVHWVLGTAPYWAEGTKPKEWNPSQRVSFTNMDPAMLLCFRRWILRYCGVQARDLSYDLYIHPSGDIPASRRFWVEVLGITGSDLMVYLKTHNPVPRRNNIGRSYHGTIRVRVRRSNDLNHRIAAWILYLATRCGVG